MRQGRKRTRAAPSEPPLSATSLVIAGTAALAVTVPAQFPEPAQAVPVDVSSTVEFLLAERVVHSPASRLTRAVLSPSRRAGMRARARAKVVAYARAHRGSWYLYGAAGPSRFDCSGLTLASMRRVGISLPHSAAQQAGRGVRVSSAHARAGDLVAYGGSHVGVYTGRHRMVDAPGTGRQIQERAVYGSPAYRRLIPLG